MSKKIIIEKNGVRREFGAGFGRHFNMLKNRHYHVENEVKLFTDKTAMVEYVNQLTGIENVEVFKIEDNLYKVLVAKKVMHQEDSDENQKDSGCCHEEENKGEDKS